MTYESAVGVDGCRAGWVCIDRNLSTRLVSICVWPTIAAVLDAFPNSLIAIDVPIGLPDKGSRACDTKARRLLGLKRGCSVFPAPVRGILNTRCYEDACKLSVKIHDKRISKQCFGILPKIREVDEAMSPDLQKRVVEIHPEVSFWALNNRTAMPDSKKKRQGFEQRRGLLEAYMPQIVDFLRVKGAQKDDVLDAAVACWSAERIAADEGETVVLVEQIDTTGLRMQISC